MNQIPSGPPSQARLARVIGFAFLLAIILVVVANYGISFRLLIPNNAGGTARNILAHETLFRVNIACDLAYVLTLLVLLTALYVTLEPVDRPLALLAAACRLLVALMWGLTALNMLGALRLLGHAAYLPAFQAEQLQALARLNLASSYDAYYVGLPFWGLSSLVFSVLWLKSRFIPRPLSIFGLIASAWCVFCAFAFIACPHFDQVVNASWFDTPLVLFELALGLWLVFKGLSPAKRTAT